MRLHRFYVNQPLAAGKTLRLADERLVHQWRRVFRFTPGYKVILFDGSGFDYEATIADFGKDTADVAVGEKALGITPSREVWLFVSIMKKDKFEWVAEKATELGVSRIVPVLSVRTEKKSLNMERLAVIAKEAAEQSGRSTLPAIDEPMPLEDSLALVADMPADTIYICDMGGKDKLSDSGDASNDKPLALFVGPEGGWSEEDRAAFAGKGFKTLGLGATVLRAETAAIVAAAMACMK